MIGDGGWIGWKPNFLFLTKRHFGAITQSVSRNVCIYIYIHIFMGGKPWCC